MSGPVDEALPELVISEQDDAIVALLRQIQRAVLAHPEAGQALFRALVAEGRLFAQTGEGRRWREKLDRSALIERAGLVWQNATLWMNEEGGDGAIPSVMIDAVTAAGASPERDELLERLYRSLDGGK